MFSDKGIVRRRLLSTTNRQRANFEYVEKSLRLSMRRNRTQQDFCTSVTSRAEVHWRDSFQELCNVCMMRLVSDHEGEMSIPFRCRHSYELHGLDV